MVGADCWKALPLKGIGRILSCCILPPDTENTVFTAFSGGGGLLFLRVGFSTPILRLETGTRLGRDTGPVSFTKPVISVKHRPGVASQHNAHQQVTFPDRQGETFASFPKAGDGRCAEPDEQGSHQEAMVDLLFGSEEEPRQEDDEER